MLRSLFQYFRPYRVRLIPIVLASALEMFFNAQIPLSVKFLIDRALVGHDEQMMFLILGALAASTVIVSLTSVARDYLYAKVAGQIITSLRQRMFEHLQRLSLAFYAGTEAGDVMSRFSNDIGAVETGLAAGVAWGLQPFLDLLLSAGLVFALEWRLAAFGFLLCPLCILGPRLLSKRATAASVAKQEEEGHILSSLQESLMAPAAVRAFNMQDLFVSRFRERNDLLFGASLRLGFMNSLMERSASFGTLLLQVIVLGASGYLAFRGVITIGTFAAFQALFVSLSYSIMYLAQYTPNLIKASGGVIRIEALLKERPGIEDGPGAVELGPLADEIELRNVQFSYSGERRVLDSVSLRIPRGAAVAFVGPSGSGKSTVLNLLLRFYDPVVGAVLFDGIDLRGVKQASLHALATIVFQESVLFNTTVRENIRLGNSRASNSEVEAAAQAAEIHDFISTLPQGYDTICGERGSRFSGGQRQRISIARSMLRDPSILLLDEATSALDPSTEAALNATFERLAQGRTMVSVTHRLSTVVYMDRIFVMDRGKVAEAGTHQELLIRDGLYARLWNKQSGVRVEAGTGRASVDGAFLAGIPLLADASAATRAELTTWFATERFEAGREIFHQGEAGDRMFIIAHGTAEVIREDSHQQLAKLSDGDYFGEMALLSDEPRNATVRAVGPCVCLTLQRGQFLELLAREPALREKIKQVVAARAAARK